MTIFMDRLSFFYGVLTSNLITNAGHMRTFVVYLKYLLKGLLILTLAQIGLKVYRVILEPAVFQFHRPTMMYHHYLEQRDENIGLLLFIAFLLILILQLIRYY